MKASVNTPSKRPSKWMCVLLMSALLMAGVTGQSTSPSLMPTVTTDPPSPAPVATDPPSLAPVVTATPVTATPTAPVTAAPVLTAAPVTETLSTPVPVTEAPVTTAPVTAAPATAAPVTAAPTTAAPATAAPVTVAPTGSPTDAPSGMPSESESTLIPTSASLSAIPSVSISPTVMPTSSPSFVPSLSAAPSEAEVVPATDAPTGSPSGSPTTQNPSAVPSEAPTTNPTSIPTRALVEESIIGLKMTLNGISELPSGAWADFASSMKSYYADLTDIGVEGPSFETIVIVQSASLDEPKQLRRQLQSSVTVTYEQAFQYIPTRDDVTVAFLATEPFATQGGRNAFLDLLQEANPVLADVVSTSEVTLPLSDAPSLAPTGEAATTEAPTTEAPTKAPEGDDDGLSRGVIFGIAVGGAAALTIILYLFMACRNNGDEYQASTAENPPNVLKVSVAGDEVSTLDGPAGNAAPASGESLAGYGDQSVATVDYDYSKAYGGGGDTSVSSAGGTFGSNAQGISALDPAKAAATGATLGGAGSFSDTDSFEAHYRDPNANIKEELIEIFAPPGKLGVVIDTPDDGAPVVHAVKDSSAIANEIKVGDKLVAVDDEDVRSMTAIKVSKLISRKNANPSRKLSIIRTTVVG